MISKQIAWLVVAALALGCAGKPGNTASGDTTTGRPDSAVMTRPDSNVMTPPDTQVTVTRRDSSRPILPPPIPGRDTVLLIVQVADIISSEALVGRRVQVTGMCLGYRVPPVALGSPPITRSDWQLESGGVAIYVVGQLPVGCTVTGGSTSPSTITGTVRQDTLPALGPNPARARRFMEREGHG